MSENWVVVSQDILARNVQTRASVGLPNQTDLTPLQIAALYEPSLAQEMVASGVAIDLHSACLLGLTDQIQRLATTDNLAIKAEGLPALGYALLKSQVASTSALLQSGDDPNGLLDRIGFFVWELKRGESGWWRPIHLVAAHGYLENSVELTRLLAEFGADLSASCVLGEQPIHLASTFNWVHVIEELLNLGVDINARTKPCLPEIHELASPKDAIPDSGLTPLMIAAREGMLDVAKVLLDRGALANVTSALGRTALHYAADAWWRESVDMVRLLLDANIDSSLEDSSGTNALDCARQRGYQRIVGALTLT